mmetsp:Transcript_53313/g.153817  ORF Transcript_53313/g.153817 Transcript_53313/m.153817 type:complete len:204 (-) Transcript_53313:154-765(-)
MTRSSWYSKAFWRILSGNCTSSSQTSRSCVGVTCMRRALQRSISDVRSRLTCSARARKSPSSPLPALRRGSASSMEATGGPAEAHGAAAAKTSLHKSSIARRRAASDGPPPENNAGKSASSDLDSPVASVAEISSEADVSGAGAPRSDGAEDFSGDAEEGLLLESAPRNRRATAQGAHSPSKSTVQEPASLSTEMAVPASRRP